jgi:hypothetical protein
MRRQFGPWRKVTRAVPMQGGGFGILSNRGHTRKFWYLDLDCGHVVQRPRPRAAVAPGKARCEECDRKERDG